VDEFQDTDPDQLRLFKALLKRDPDDPHEVLGFFVGDTKQSIYRFRSADVPSIKDFCHHYERYTGCQLEQSEFRLKTSFRSVKAVTQFVNHFFEKELELTDEDDALVPFRPDEEVLPEWIFTDTDEEGRDFNVDRGRGYAAAQTLQMIQEYLQSSTSEKPPYKDILVLVRNWQDVDALLPVLQNAGIPVISSGAKTFYRQPEVMDLLNLLIALLHPQDRLAVAAVLRGPLLYLSDPQLHDLLKEIPPERLFHSQEPLPDFLPEEVRARIQHLRKLAAGRLESTLSEWLGEVRAFIPTALYTQPGDREGRPLVRIGRVLENFKEAMEMTVIPPLVWLLKQRTRAAETGRWDDNNPGEDITVATENVDAVRVMTIHKAKGLEGRFTIVYGWSSVLSELGDSPAKRTPPKVLNLTDEDGQRVQAFSLRWGPLKIVSSSYSEALDEERKGVRAEAERLAYVATTRARDRMALLCPGSTGRLFPERIRSFIASAKSKLPADSESGQVKICNGTLRFVHQPGFKTATPKVTPPSVNLQENAYQSLWENRYSDYRAARPPLLRHPSDPEHREEEEIREDDHYRRGRDRETSLLVGRLAHTYLERYLLDDAFERDRLSLCFSGISELHSHGNVIEAAEKVLEQFYAGDLVDSSGRPYRERVQAGRVLGREIPVYLRDDGQAWHGIIDLVLEEEGIIRAIDYKTTARQDPLPEAYTQQQRIYSEALRRLFPDQDTAFEFWWMR
jgi:ATP-dependent helicase/nuclease subunit A